MNFVNCGTDEKTVEFITKSLKDGKIPTIVTAHRKDGTVYQTTVYKDPAQQQISQHSTRHRKTIVQILNPDNNYMDLATHQVYSLAEVTDKYNKLGNKSISLEAYVKTQFFVSDGKNITVDFYRIRRGEYNKNRFKSVHFPIIQQKLAEGDKPPAGKKPICILYGGGSASGKSTIIQNIVQPVLDKTGLKFATLDCDALKEQLPEFQMFDKENPKTSFMRVHRESSDLTHECIKALIQSGKCFSWDGCMGNFELYKKIVGHLKQAGYEVHVVGATVPIETAIQRSKQRRRLVPEYIIQQNHKEFSLTFPKIMELPVDSVSLYDNSQPPGQPNQCIINSQGIQNQKLWDEFLKKGVL